VYGQDATKLYAGKITNNVVQATARIVMTDGMLRVAKSYPVKGTVHDELIAVVPDAEVENAKTWVLAQMTMEPRYMPGIPLNADGGAHRRYGLAKG
jgi:DNA polymerase